MFQVCSLQKRLSRSAFFLLWYTRLCSFKFSNVSFLRTLCGCRVRVELSNGEKRSRNRGPPPSWGRRPRDDYRRRSPPPRRRYLRACLEVLV